MMFSYVIKIFQKPVLKWGLIVSINLAIIGSLHSLLKVNLTKNKNNSQLISVQLSDIQSQLFRIHQQSSKSCEEIDLNPLKQSLTNLEHLIKSLESNNRNEIKNLIAKDNELTHKIETIYQEVTAAHQNPESTKFLSSDKLPFSILSIDSIQEACVLTTFYNDKTIALEKDDSLAGWALKKISFAKQQAEFINNKHEHILVQLGVQKDNHNE